MAEKLNATCSICGEKYHVCNTCKSTKSFTPWRIIADTPNCYKIYMIIYQYNYKMFTKDQAKEMLKNCTIPDKLQDHIKKVIDEIMSEDTTNENIKIKSKKGVSKTKNNE